MNETFTPTEAAGKLVEITEEWNGSRKQPVKDFIAARMADGMTRASAKEQYRKEKAQRVFESPRYRVFLQAHGPDNCMWHISIRPLCSTPRHDWREMQDIKNQILGPEFEAVELFPAESRLMDECNQFHLFACTSAEERMPFGHWGKRVADEPGAPGTCQRGRDGITRLMDSNGNVKKLWGQ